MKKVKTYEVYYQDAIELNEYYEIRYEDHTGDEVKVEYNDYNDPYDHFNYDPFDLKDTVRLLIKLEKEDPDVEFFIVKITETSVSNKEIEEIKISFDSEKFNL